jgi:hypothetical protein
MARLKDCIASVKRWIVHADKNIKTIGSVRLASYPAKKEA